MKRAIGTGIQDFESLRVNHDFYVDKTEFIREWWKGRDAVTLIARPRRFGKTLNMSMLNCFFSNKYENRGELFEGLSVWEDPETRKEQGQWPVVFLTFAGMKATTFEEARASLNQLIEDTYGQYRMMLREPLFSDADRAFFEKVQAEMPDYVAAISIRKLCDWLSAYYGKKVLIFLVELQERARPHRDGACEGAFGAGNARGGVR